MNNYWDNDDTFSGYVYICPKKNTKLKLKISKQINAINIRELKKDIKQLNKELNRKIKELRKREHKT